MSSPLAAHAGNGLDFLRALARGEGPNVPIGDTLGFRVTGAEPGIVRLEGRPDERSYNLIGTVHGGWTAAILDTALALCVLSVLDESQSFTTIDFRINFLKPITSASGLLAAEGRLIQGGRRVAYAEAKLADASGRLLAHGTGSCLVVPRAPAAP